MTEKSENRRLRIIPFGSQDQIPLAEFWSKIFAEMGWRMDGRIGGMDDIPGYFGFPHGFYFIGKEKREIVGCGGVGPLNQTTGILKRFYIAPCLRGTGASDRLLEKILVESRNHRFSRLELDVYYSNARAARFYEKHGFAKFVPVKAQCWEDPRYADKFLFYRLDLGKSKQQK